MVNGDYSDYAPSNFFCISSSSQSVVFWWYMNPPRGLLSSYLVMGSIYKPAPPFLHILNISSILTALPAAVLLGNLDASGATLICMHDCFASKNEYLSKACTFEKKCYPDYYDRVNCIPSVAIIGMLFLKKHEIVWKNMTINKDVFSSGFSLPHEGDCGNSFTEMNWTGTALI